ncbi:RNA 3'-terminal phosphate cyclase [Kordiimonas sp. SCSIO 12610]|uniref:RNA 3'-terminal phosphate cyclase n=1 Tax=Kordiimonas sp. SCSIO 12610 TaxID=2829597 RepID=UPI00210EECC2|nr:RNA 3'-terminal phosphate cyclase [Kordiimonas sp. SCSIO 12610]UTW54812.1 RNA 3'-terminal phosphate cyclase [Kordiimonas sp. SCSIO 12610]
MKKIIKIDGSKGEGGGQVLRTSLSLSMITGHPFIIENIRANRKKLGLMRQHLTCVKAAATICGATIEGAELGSSTVSFIPNAVKAGLYDFSIGTAGSTLLVLQTLLPALMLANNPSKLHLNGGTHNKQAPSFEFINNAYIPILAKMGVRIDALLERRGFFPAGGGQVAFDITPTTKLNPIDLSDGGKIKKVLAKAILAKIPMNIGPRELKVAKSRLNIDEANCIVIDDRNTDGPGNTFSIEVQREHVTEVFVQHGELGVSAESVAKNACRSAGRYLRAPDAAVGPYLADQLLLPMSLAGKGKFTTLRPSLHTITNIDTIKQFLDVDIQLIETGEGIWTIEVGRNF